MTLFVDGKHDIYYNEDFLKKSDKTFLRGFDYAYDEIINLFLNNLDIWQDWLSYDPEAPKEDTKEEVYAHTEGLYDILQKNKGILKMIMEQHLDSSRDYLIVSMIDGMDDDDYENERKKAFAENAARPKSEQKEYYDTKHFFCTGEKIADENT